MSRKYNIDFVCEECSEVYSMNKHSANRRERSLCQKCSKEASDIKKRVKLTQSMFVCEFVKEHGDICMLHDRHRVRTAIFRCNDCKSEFISRIDVHGVRRGHGRCDTCKSGRNTSHPLYKVWNGIKQRCYTKTRKDYYNYGGKGVTMCEEWVDNPTAFIDWCVSNGWKQGLHVDKDILSNKLNIHPAMYAPQTITFVTNSENIREAHSTEDKEVLAVDVVTAEIVEKYPLPISAFEKYRHFFKCTDRISMMCNKPKKRKSKFNVISITTHKEIQFIYRKNYETLKASLLGNK